MKEITKSLLSVILVVLIAVLGYFLYQNYGEAKAEKAKQAAQAAPSPIVSAAPSPSPSPTAVEDVSLAVCGDVVCHMGLNAEAKNKDGAYDFAPIFTGVRSFVADADYAWCTVETTFPDTAEYSGYPMFKSPAALVSGLKTVGFDMINTANNHCMDSGRDGLIKTLDVLDTNGLDHIGTYRTQEEHDKNSGILVKEINGVKIAFLSFTYGTNGMPVTGYPYVANIFCRDYLTNLADVDYDLLKKDMEAAKALKPDFTIVLMHWGNEYHTEPNDQQKALADFLFQQGADAVIGGHPHVPEPMELRRVKDVYGNEKTGLLAYCLGNFVSCQNDRYTNLTAVLDIDVEKNLDTGKTALKTVSYAPMYMVDLSDVKAAADWQYRLWNLHDAIESYKNGNNLGAINDTLFNNMVQGLADVQGILGAEFDTYNGGVDVAAWTEKNR